jgi:MFS family permease
VIGVHMVFALVIPPVIYLIPKLSQDELHIGASSYGALLGVFGIGAIAAAVLLGNSEGRVRRSRALTLGIMMAVVSMAGLSVAHNYLGALTAMVVLGAAYLVVVSVDHGAIQTYTDDQFRGRVTSVWLMTFGLCMPFGVLGQGALTDAIGVRKVFAIDAAIMCALIIVLTIRRVLARLDPNPATAYSNSFP